MSWLDHPLLDAALNLTLAMLLALPLGRGRESMRAAGLRTFPLLSVAPCAGVLLSRSELAADLGAQANVFDGLPCGLAIFGAGALLDDTDHGMVTAVSLWVAAPSAWACARSPWRFACWGSRR